MIANKIREEAYFPYQVSSKLGVGMFGEVSKVKRMQDGEVFAMKLLKSPLLRRNPRLNQMIEDEVTGMLGKAHPHIVTLYDAFAINGDKFLIYELCEPKSLKTRLKTGGVWSEDRVIEMGKQLLTALKYIHGLSIIHRDIKPDNILIKDGCFKLADFGLCYRGGTHYDKDLIGSPAYLAPEILKDRRYSEKSDVYALGLSMFELLNGRYPFEQRNEIELMKKKYEFFPSKKTLPNCSNETIDILLHMMHPKIDSRASVQQLIDRLGVDLSYVNHFINSYQHSFFCDHNAITVQQPKQPAFVRQLSLPTAATYSEYSTGDYQYGAAYTYPQQHVERDENYYPVHYEQSIEAGEAQGSAGWQMNRDALRDIPQPTQNVNYQPPEYPAYPVEQASYSPAFVQTTEKGQLSASEKYLAQKPVVHSTPVNSLKPPTAPKKPTPNQRHTSKNRITGPPNPSTSSKPLDTAQYQKPPIARQSSMNLLTPSNGQQPFEVNLYAAPIYPEPTSFTNAHRTASSRHVQIFDDTPQSFSKPPISCTASSYLLPYQQEIRGPTLGIHQPQLTADYSLPSRPQSNLLSNDFDWKNYQMDTKQSDQEYQAIIHDVSSQLDAAAQDTYSHPHHPHHPHHQQHYAAPNNYRDHSALY